MTYLKVWTSFRESIAPLNDAEKGRLFDAMLLYAETGEEPSEFRGNERFLWAVAKQDIDRTAQKCEALRANGSKGGIAKSKNQQELANDSKFYQTVANDSNDQQTEAKAGHKEKKRNEKKGNENGLKDDDDDDDDDNSVDDRARARMFEAYGFDFFVDQVDVERSREAGKAFELNYGRKATPAELKQLVTSARLSQASPQMLALAIAKAANNGAKNPVKYVPHILREWRILEVWTPDDAEEQQVLYDMENGEHMIDPLEAYRLQQEQVARRKQAHEERMQEGTDGQGAAGA